MQPLPRVSVVLPVKNGARYLAAALESVQEQSLKPEEILVVDGHSVDGSPEIARSFPNVRVLVQQNTGLAEAWNTGIKAARGDLIAFIESDDRWAPDKLQLQVECFTRRPAAQYVIGRVHFFLEDGHAVPRGFKQELLQGSHVGRIPGTLLVRRSLFRDVGVFDPALTIAADVDWFARCKDAGVSEAVLEEVLLYKRVHDRNLSSDAGKNTRELLKLLRTSIGRRRDNAIDAP